MQGQGRLSRMPFRATLQAGIWGLIFQRLESRETAGLYNWLSFRAQHITDDGTQGVRLVVQESDDGTTWTKRYEHPVKLMPGGQVDVSTYVQKAYARVIGYSAVRADLDLTVFCPEEHASQTLVGQDMVSLSSEDQAKTLCQSACELAAEAALQTPELVTYGIGGSSDGEAYPAAPQVKQEWPEGTGPESITLTPDAEIQYQVKYSDDEAYSEAADLPVEGVILEREGETVDGFILIQKTQGSPAVTVDFAPEGVSTFDITVPGWLPASESTAAAEVNLDFSDLELANRPDALLVVNLEGNTEQATKNLVYQVKYTGGELSEAAELSLDPLATVLHSSGKRVEQLVIKPAAVGNLPTQVKIAQYIWPVQH